MITVILDDSSNMYTDLIKNALFKSEEKAVIFKADNMNIDPCLACASCSGKTYGHCVVKDDMQELLPKIVRSKKIVLVSPIIYGGVSFRIKKIMDKMCSIGDPRYYVRNGEMVKKMRIPNLKYYMIGIKENLAEEERTAFIRLHKENITIMDVEGKAYTIDSKPDKNAVEKIVKEICYA